MRMICNGKHSYALVFAFTFVVVYSYVEIINELSSAAIKLKI